MSTWLGCARNFSAQKFHHTLFCDVSVKVFLDEMNTEISALGAKQIALPKVGGGWASHDQLKA